MALASEVRNANPITIAEGLDYILTHFSQANLFPRKISTKTSQGKQFLVYNRAEALARFNQANLLDCRIAAYHSTNWRKGLNKSVAPDFLFIDLDLGTLQTMQLLDTALTATLKNIKEKLSGVPSVTWSGNGYHIYQPVEAFVLDEQDIFSKFEQPSRRLLQYAEQYLTNNKMDKCHNLTMSLNNCMVRIPYSYNSKSQPFKQVRIVQRWDGKRPDIRPLLHGCYIYMQDLRVKQILRQQKYGDQDQAERHYHPNGKFCPYWRIDKGT